MTRQITRHGENLSIRFNSFGGIKNVKAAENLKKQSTIFDLMAA